MTPAEPIKILFLSANPKGTQKLDTSDEFLQVHKALQHDSRFKLLAYDQVSATQLQDLLKDEQPHILHFSGHGTNRYGDLLTQSAYGDKETLPLDVLAKVIATLRGHLPLRFVVLNACWSLVMAEQLQKQVDAVIGMTDAIGDDAAAQFAEGFYSALRSGLSLPHAVEYGKDKIAVNQRLDGSVPSFVVRPGLDPEKMFIRDGEIVVPELPLEWGSEAEGDLSRPQKALDDTIIDHLLALYPRELGKIGQRERISAGMSGASVFVVTIQTDKIQTHSAFIKIDHHARIVRECHIHKSVTRSTIAPYVPALLCEPLGPIDGWSAAIYQTAGGTRLFARSLDGALAADAPGASAQKSAPLQALLDKALAAWHADMVRVQPDPALQDDRRNWVPTLIEAMLNLGGKNRLGDVLRDRAREHGIGGEGSPILQFTDSDELLPNPIAYLLKDSYWYDADGKPIRIDAPRAPVHGDLHGGNLICLLDSSGKLPLNQSPMVIDFALSTSSGIPFYDLAYLEMDILLRRMPANRGSRADWQAWLDMTKFLASAVEPVGEPSTEILERIWGLIKPIRTYAASLIVRGGDRDTRAQFERAFWLAAMAAGVMVTRRSRMEPPEKHKAALLYAARMLKKLMAALQMRQLNAAPYPIDWERPPLSEAMVAAYYEGAERAIIDSFRAEYKTVGAWAEPLAGEQTPHLSDRHDLRGQPMEDAELDSGLLEMMEMLGPVAGNHLETAQDDGDLPKALDEAAPVKDVPDTLFGLSRAVLIGEPGAGKTVTLEQLMIRHIAARKADSRHPVPVLVPLARFDGKQSFSDYARSYLLNLGDYADELPMVWLLDALNEMPSTGIKTGETKPRELLPEVIGFLKDELAAGEQRKFDRRFVLSCRVADYRDELRSIDGVDKVALRPLSPEQIRRIIQRRLQKKPAVAEALWRELKGSDELLAAYSAFAAAGNTEDFWDENRMPTDVAWQYIKDPTLLDSLKQRLENNESVTWADIPVPFTDDMTARKAMLKDERGLLKLCRNPFDLTLLITLALSRGMDKLPTDRAGLLIQQAEARLNYEKQEGTRRKDSSWTESTIARIKAALTQIAVAIQDTEQRTEVSAEAALTAAADSDAAELLRKAERATLIQYRDTIRFQHQLWQEYFASFTLLRAMENGESPARFFGETWWNAGAWRESLKFLLQVSGDPAKVARWLAPYSPEVALNVLPEAALLVANASKGETLSMPSDSAPSVRASLIAGANAHKNDGDPRGRAAAYRVLGRLGADERRGIGCIDNVPDIEWCEVPEDGEWIYQDNKHEPLPTFYIAKYQITYAQFQAFADAPDGYRDPKWWEGLYEDGLRQQEKGAGKQAWPIANHPRENVSWYEAVAFCRWLSTKLGYEVTLPTEEQWEKAARGIDGREYPYSGEFDANKGNTSETGLGQTSTVGIFPDGASPYGVLDLSGNILEWVLTEYKSKISNMLSNNERRVVRGGSWDYDSVNARAACRLVSDPVSRYYFIGFRVSVGVRPPSL